MFNNGAALQMRARHCNNIGRSLGHVNLLHPSNPIHVNLKTQFLSKQYYHVWLQNCYTMFLHYNILCNIYLYYNEDYVVLIVNYYCFGFYDLVTARLVSAVQQCVLALVIFSYRLEYRRCKIHGLIEHCSIKCSNGVFKC